MKTPSQLRQWASGSSAKNVGDVNKRRHANELSYFGERFDYMISMAKIYGNVEAAEKAEELCLGILQNGTDNQKLFEIAFNRIDEAIGLIGQLNSEEKKKAADSNSKIHGGLLAPILSKFRRLLS